MTAEEALPSGAEFEDFCRELDSFISGYFYALGSEEEPAYARGDFFGERTEAIYFKDRAQLTERFVRAVQRWLAAPRRSNWRVLIPGEKLEENYIVIYDELIVLAPAIGTLSNAIAEKKKA